MKKIFTTLAAAALVAVSAQAKLEVTNNGTPLENGATIEFTNADFNCTSMPEFNYFKWEAVCHPDVVSSSFMHTYVTSTAKNYNFCTSTCFMPKQDGDQWIVDQPWNMKEGQIQMHFEYGTENLPTAEESVKVKITNTDGDTFEFTAVFKTTDTSGVEEIVAASANVAGIYDLQGRPVSEDFRGVAIVVYDNGKAVKQVIK